MTENSNSTKPQVAKVEWYYERDGAVVGPITEARLRYALKYGHIKPDTLIWRNDLEHWLEAACVPMAAAVLNRAPSSPSIESTSTSVRLRVELRDPGPVAADPKPMEDLQETTATETQTQGSPEDDTSCAEVLHDAITDEEAADPVIDVNMARAIVERARGFHRESSIPPASVTFRPPANASSWLVPTPAGRARLFAFAAASILVLAAVLLLALRAPPQAEPASEVRSDPQIRYETLAPTSAGAGSAAPRAQTEGAAIQASPDANSASKPPPPAVASALAEHLVTVEGPLDAAPFLQHLKRSMLVFEEQCWVVYRAPGAKVASPAVTIELDVDRAGRVYDVRWGKAPKGYRGVGRCIAGRMRGWKFPAAERGTHARVTVERAHD